MRRWTKTLLVVTGLWLGTHGAHADDPGGEIHVKGNVPAVCSLGGWQLQSGPADFQGGYNAVATYDAATLAALGPGSALTFVAPLNCNTAITWSFTTAKGAFALDNGGPPPSGFADRWSYDLTAAPYTEGGSVVGFRPSLTSSGAPVSESFGLGQRDAETIDHMGIVFTPISQPLHMLAGHYSETISLTVSPTI
jgi:hypothetical protein